MTRNEFIAILLLLGWEHKLRNMYTKGLGNRVTVFNPRPSVIVTVSNYTKVYKTYKKALKQIVTYDSKRIKG